MPAVISVLSALKIEQRKLLMSGLAAEMRFELPVRNRGSALVISMTYVARAELSGASPPRGKHTCSEHPGIFASDPTAIANRVRHSG